MENLISEHKKICPIAKQNKKRQVEQKNIL